MALSKCENCDDIMSGYNSMTLQFFNAVGINKYKYSERVLFGDFFAGGIALKTETFMAIAKSIVDQKGPLTQTYIPSNAEIDKKHLLSSKNLLFVGEPKWQNDDIKNYKEACHATACEVIKFEIHRKDICRLKEIDAIDESLECPAKFFHNEAWEYPISFAKFYDFFNVFTSFGITYKLQKIFPKGITVYLRIAHEKKIDRKDLEHLFQQDVVRRCQERLKPVTFQIELLEAEDFEREKECYGV